MRRRLSYANVTATLALVFAMSGGAMAANHYLINSTKQINPKVLKKLTGKAGAAGAAGATGSAGAIGKEGPQGKEGSKGEKGEPGKEGSPGKNGEPGKEGKEGKEGPIGPSEGFATADRSFGHVDTQTTSKNLQVGKYVITAVITAYNTGPDSTEVDCFNSNGETSPFAILATHTATPITDTWAQTLSTAGTVSFKCTRVDGTGPEELGYASLTAIKVGNLS